MTKYAMYRRRGSSPAGESTAPALPPVILDAETTDTLSWSSFIGPDPDQWVIYLAGVSLDSVPGTDRSYTAILTGSFTVQGIAPDLSPVTQMSNAQTLPP